MENVPKFTYIKTPLNKYTFKVPKIRRWVEEFAEGRVLNLFAGLIKLDLDEVRNDIRESMEADYHLDALEFVKQYKGEEFNTILLDPPYSYRKSMEMYDGKVMSSFNAVKNELPMILSNNGMVMTFGYHSTVMGKSRGFEIEHICLMSHGGAIHDTIASIERRILV